MQRSDQRVAGGTRIAVLGAGHLVMLAVMFVLLERYEPEPNGFRFNSPMKLGAFAAMTLPPIVIGLAARRITAAALVGLLQAASPLLLIDNMRDPGSDLNFAILLWWLPLPAAAGLVVIVDRVVRYAETPHQTS